MAANTEHVTPGKALQINQDLVLMQKRDAEAAILLFAKCKEFLKIWRDGAPHDGYCMIAAVDAMEDVVEGIEDREKETSDHH